MATIASLPVEILRLVFSYYAATTNEPSDDTITERAPECIILSHVCHQWRVVALQHKRLWGHINPNFSSKWASECATRSYPTPMSLKATRLSLNNPDNASILRNVLHHETFRLQGFDYKETRRDNDDEIGIGDLLIESPAPLLENFTVETTSPDFTLMSDLFAGHAPRLSSLRLRGTVQLGTNFRILENIRELEIHRPCTVAWYLEALRHTPRIECARLHIEGLGSVRPPQEGYTIIIPTLKKVEVHAQTLTDLGVFVYRVQGSSGVQLSIKVGTDRHDGINPSQAFQSLVEFFDIRCTYFQLQREIRLEDMWIHVGRKGWRLTWWDSYSQSAELEGLMSQRALRWYLDGEIKVDKSTAVDLEFSWHNNAGQERPCPITASLRSILTALQSMAGQSEVATVAFTMDNDLKHSIDRCSCVSVLKEVFDNVSGMRILKLSKEIAETALSALVPPPAGPIRETSATLPFVIPYKKSAALKKLEELVVEVPDVTSQTYAFEAVLKFLAYRDDGLRRLMAVHLYCMRCRGNCALSNDLEGLAPLVDVGVHCLRCNQWEAHPQDFVDIVVYDRMDSRPWDTTPSWPEEVMEEKLRVKKDDHIGDVLIRACILLGRKYQYPNAALLRPLLEHMNSDEAIRMWDGKDALHYSRSRRVGESGIVTGMRLALFPEESQA